MMVEYSNKYKTWMPEEDNLLKDNWIIPPDIAKFAELLGRTQIAIRNRAKRLGLKVSNVKYKPGSHAKVLEAKKENLAKFCDKFKEIRLFKKTLKELHLSRNTVMLEVENNEEFKRKFYEVKSYINNTFVCKTCKTIFNNSECYTNVESCPTASKYCKTCGKKKRIKSMNSKDDIFSHFCSKAKQNQQGLFAKGIDDLGFAQKKNLSKNIQFDISKNYLEQLYEKQERKCYYTGFKMKLKYETDKKRDFYLVSIDRKDSNKGYTQDNVVLCCWGINRMKQDVPYDEFLEICRIITDKFPNYKGQY